MIDIGKDGVTVTMTRGDYFERKVDLFLFLDNELGPPYEPQPGDTIKFALKHDCMTPKRTEFTDERPLVEKDIDPDDLLLILRHEDTAKLHFGNYRYDIKLFRPGKDPDTVIEDALWKLARDVGGKKCPTD